MRMKAAAKALHTTCQALLVATLDGVLATLEATKSFASTAAAARPAPTPHALRDAGKGAAPALLRFAQPTSDPSLRLAALDALTRPGEEDPRSEIAASVA